MPTSRLSTEETFHEWTDYALRARNWTAEECERIEARFHYTPRQEPEEMP